MASTTEMVSFLTLPLEIRSQILFNVFFPLKGSPDHPESGNGSTFNIPFNSGPGKPLHRFRKIYTDTSIICVCRQLQSEGEEILYSNATLCLIGADYRRLISHINYNICKRHQELIRSIHMDNWVPLMPYDPPFCSWKELLYLFSRDFVSLHSLVLPIPTGRDDEIEEAYPPLGLDISGWLQPLHAIKGLEHFKLECVVSHRDLDPALATALTTNQPPFIRQGSFRLLNLQRNIRNIIYRHMTIPQNRAVHPHLAPGVDGTTTNIIPLFQTCREIYKEAEAVLYSEAIFSFCSYTHRQEVEIFCSARNSRQLNLMRRIYIRGRNKTESFGERRACSEEMFSYFTRFMEENPQIGYDMLPPDERAEYHPCSRDYFVERPREACYRGRHLFW